jgi:hypothetical protein
VLCNIFYIVSMHLSCGNNTSPSILPQILSSYQVWDVSFLRSFGDVQGISSLKVPDDIICCKPLKPHFWHDTFPPHLKLVTRRNTSYKNHVILKHNPNKGVLITKTDPYVVNSNAQETTNTGQAIGEMWRCWHMSKRQIKKIMKIIIVHLTTSMTPNIRSHASWCNYKALTTTQQPLQQIHKLVYYQNL